MTITWSEYQNDIFEAGVALANGELDADGIIVAAGPGSGKSTTLEQLIRRIGRGTAIAFNKSIADAMNERLEDLPGANASTINSYMYNSFDRKPWTVGSKYAKLAIGYTRTLGLENASKAWSVAYDMQRFINLLRVNRVSIDDTQGIHDLLDTYGNGFQISPFGGDYRNAYRVIMSLGRWLASDRYKYTGAWLETLGELRPLGERILAGLQMGKKYRDKRTGKMKGWTPKRHIDFVEQIELPLDGGFVRPEPTGILLVDEWQDLSQLMIEAILQMIGDGKIIVVGDPLQSIYMFNGAHEDSIDFLKRQRNMVELPLNITYRCPKSHVSLLNTINPDLEAAPNAIEGEIVQSDLAETIGWMKQREGEEVMALSRTNASGLRFAFALLSQGIPADIAGKSFGDDLIRVLEKISQHEDFDWGEFEVGVDRWYNAEYEKAVARAARQSSMTLLKDKAQSILLFQQWYTETRSGGGSVDGLIDYIQNFFNDDERKHDVLISTVHRAKGSEADNVILINPSREMPLIFSGNRQTPAEIKQEWNIVYVAQSRAKKAMIFCDLPDEQNM